jgi:tetratricopeptide (TPR) repeat protein
MGRQAVYYSTQPTPEELENAKAYTEFAKDPWLHKAVNADLNGQWEKAEEYARKAIESSPNKPAPHELLSAIYHRQGKKELALQEALTAERLSSNDDLKKFPGTYLSLADLYSELKEYDKAIEYYKKVLSTHEGYLLAHEGLATVYEKVCMTDSAVKQYQILLESQEEHFHKQGLEGLERLKKTPCLKTQ